MLAQLRKIMWLMSHWKPVVAQAANQDVQCALADVHESKDTRFNESSIVAHPSEKKEVLYSLEDGFHLLLVEVLWMVAPLARVEYCDQAKVGEAKRPKPA